MSKNKDKIIRRGCARGVGQLDFKIGKDEIAIKKARSSGGTVFSIIVNGDPEKVKIKNPTAGKLYIEQLLGIDFTAWKNSIVLGQNASSLFIEGGAKSKSDLIGSILNFDLIDAGLKLIKERYTAVSSKRIASLEADLKASEDTIQEVQINQDDVKIKAQQAQQEIKKIRSDIDDRKLKLSEQSNVKKKVIEYQELLQKINFSKQKIDTENEALNSKNAAYKKSLLELAEYEKQLKQLNLKKTEQNKIVEEIASLATSRLALEKKVLVLSTDINTKQVEYKKVKQKWENIKDLSTCEHCGNPITEKCLGVFKANIDKIASEIFPLVQEKKTLELQISGIDDKHASLMEHVDSTLDKKINAYTVQVNSKPSLDKNIQDYRKTHQKLIDSYNTNIEEIDYQAKQIEKLNLRYDKTYVLNLELEVQAFESQIEEKLKEMSEMEAKLKIVEMAKARILKTRDSLVNAKIEHDKNLQAQEAFDTQGFRNLLIKKLTPFIQKKLQEYLVDVNKSDHEILLTFEPKFDIKFFVGGVEQDVSLFSGGESRLFSIIFNLVMTDTVLKNGKFFNFRIYDEVFDDLDTENKILCVDLLRKLAEKNKEQIFVITHDQFSKDLIAARESGRITVIKQNNVSTVKN
jgi:DNA repair exonuclease SbcCD ATPase subunit